MMWLEMLSEMLGELNASHTGARYYASNSALTTANLGVFFDPQYQGDGLKIQEIIKRGPFDVKNTGVTAGSIIENIVRHHLSLYEEDFEAWRKL